MPRSPVKGSGSGARNSSWGLGTVEEVAARVDWREPRLNSWVIHFIMAWLLPERAQKSCSCSLSQLSWYLMYSIRFDQTLRLFSLNVYSSRGARFSQAGGQAAGWQQGQRAWSTLVWNNYHLAFYHFGESIKGWRDGPVFKAAGFIGWWRTDELQRESEVRGRSQLKLMIRRPEGELGYKNSKCQLL